MQEFSEIDNLPPVSQRDIQTYTRWRQVCELVQMSRASGLPTAANDVLTRMIAADPKDTLAPFFQLWLADNFLLAGDLRASIGAYRQVHENYSDRRFCGEALGAIALQNCIGLRTCISVEPILKHISPEEPAKISRAT